MNLKQGALAWQALRFIDKHATEEENVFELLPVELVENIFSFLSVEDLEASLLVCRHWYRIASNNILWRHRIRSRKWKGVSEEYVNTELSLSLQGFKWPSARSLYLHLDTLVTSRKIEQRVSLWNKKGYTNKQRARCQQKGLYPMTSHNHQNEIEDIEFVTRRHIIGFVAYLLPIVGATWGGRAGALLTLIGCIVRYFTFQSYYDMGKRFPRREAGLACRNCFIWGIAITVFFRVVAFIVRNSHNLHIEDSTSSSSSSSSSSSDSSSPFSGGIEWHWPSSSASDPASGGYSYRSIGSVSLPSFFK